MYLRLSPMCRIWPEIDTGTYCWWVPGFVSVCQTTCDEVSGGFVLPPSYCSCIVVIVGQRKVIHSGALRWPASLQKIGLPTWFYSVRAIARRITVWSRSGSSNGIAGIKATRRKVLHRHGGTNELLPRRSVTEQFCLCGMLARWK